MKYPDGEQISLGDHIWWNEGSSIGFVHEIIESPGDQAEWNFDQPHILLSGFHPHNPGGPGYVAYPRSDFEDEGICVLTSNEEKDFIAALESARTSPGFVEPFHVRFELPLREWVFETLEDTRFKELARVASTLP